MAHKVSRRTAARQRTHPYLLRGMSRHDKLPAHATRSLRRSCMTSARLASRLGGLLLAISLPLPLAAQASAANAAKGELPLKLAPRPTSPAISAADLMTRLYIFADDSMMGRQVGTEYNLKGTERSEERRV